MTERTNHFQENLKHLRHIHQESQEDLAKAIGIKRERLAKWETSLSRTPSIEGYAAIAEHYGVTIERLVFADLTYKEVPRYPESTTDLWFAQRIFFPIAHSEEAMRIRSYREGHSLLTSALKEQNSDVFIKLEKAEDYFYKAYKESGSVEGACNYVITLLLIAACICNPEISEKALNLVDNPKQVPKFFRKLHLGTIPVHTELTSKLHELFVSEHTERIDEILEMLKESAYSDLADYYSALRLLFGFGSSYDDFDTNFEIGSLTLQLLSVKHNPYAHRFITTVEALKRAHADIAGRL